MRISDADIQKRITRRDDKKFDIINYDYDNAYPQRVDDIAASSGIAKSCIDVYKKFLTGQGFTDTAFADTVIADKGYKGSDLHNAVSKDFAKRGGFAIHVNYNLLGEATTFRHVPFSHCRLWIDEDTGGICGIAVYEDWGREVSSKIDEKKIDYIDLYNPDKEIVLNQIAKAGSIEKYKGQIFYYGMDGMVMYPLAPYDAELEDMETDGQIKLFKYRGVTGTFMASHMLVTYGQFEDSKPGFAPAAPPLGGKPEDSNKPQPTLDQQRAAFVERIKNFQGAKNFNRVMHIEADTPQQKPELVPFTHQNNDKLFEYHETSTQANIRKVFTIPSIFIEAVPGSLGLSAQLRDAIMFYNRITVDERIIMTNAYKKLLGAKFSTATFEIKELDKFNVPTVEVKDVLDSVTTNEKRAMVGLPEQQQAADNVTLAQKLGVGGTQAFQSIIVDTTLTREQKAGALKVLFTLSDEQINLLLPVTP